jgi:hypothetical protein
MAVAVKVLLIEAMRKGSPISLSRSVSKFAVPKALTYSPIPGIQMPTATLGRLFSSIVVSMRASTRLTISAGRVADSVWAKAREVVKMNARNQMRFILVFVPLSPLKGQTTGQYWVGVTIWFNDKILF